MVVDSSTTIAVKTCCRENDIPGIKGGNWLGHHWHISHHHGDNRRCLSVDVLLISQWLLFSWLFSFSVCSDVQLLDPRIPLSVELISFSVQDNYVFPSWPATRAYCIAWYNIALLFLKKISISAILLQVIILCSWTKARSSPRAIKVQITNKTQTKFSLQNVAVNGKLNDLQFEYILTLHLCTGQ